MADIAARKVRPEFRNIHISQILSYRLPPAGIVSILHRLSGVLLFLVGIPFCLYLLQQSLTSEISFESYRAIVGSIPGKLVLLVLLWAFLPSPGSATCCLIGIWAFSRNLHVCPRKSCW
jgi:succinate dehydrogenase / fumarate reductase cytochrome b subunit